VTAPMPPISFMTDMILTILFWIQTGRRDSASR
jgi:hypothetical protein